MSRKTTIQKPDVFAILNWATENHPDRVAAIMWLPSHVQLSALQSLWEEAGRPDLKPYQS